LSRAPKPTLFRTTTRDGWKIALWNYRATERRTPVLLVHGLGSNRYDLDYPDDRYSLARFLHKAGFNVFVVELRGAGASNNRLRKAISGYTIDDYLTHDIPSALRLIEDETGEDAVHWAGHSLGGMLAYPMIGTTPARIRSAATLGAPLMQHLDHKKFEFLVPVVAAFLKRVPYFWGYKRALQVGSYAMKLTAPIVGHYLFTLENCDLGDLARISRVAIDDVPSAINLQMIEWYFEKRMTTHYGTVDVVEGLARSTTPLMVVAGATDRLTALADVRVAYDRSGATSKELVICGREHGFSADYGHIDMVFGKKAHLEVFPRIRDWFVRHDSPRRAVAGENGKATPGTPPVPAARNAKQGG
jgi:pimeloyl-ACP methyl ester carboxylesterase